MTVPVVPGRLLPLLTGEQIGELKPALAEVIEYRKSGLSLNHIVGCPLECGYCVRHLFDNFDMKTPKRLMTDEAAVAALVSHPYFRPHRTPIQLFNRATDPMLPVVKPHLFAVLRDLDDRGLTNHVLVITRWRVSAQDCAVLNSHTNLRLTILVTHSGIDDPAIEPVNSTYAADSLRMLYEHADRYRTVLYWRPIVPGLNDSDEHIERARELSLHAHATVFTGLFFRDEIRAYYEAHGLPTPYDATARRKIMPELAEQRITEAYASRNEPGGAPWGTLFLKTSCGVAYAHGEADYNGHFGIEELCRICPPEQIALCKGAWARPDLAEVTRQARALGAIGDVEINDRAIVVEGLDEPPRYYLQHGFGYQCHDRAKPHLYRRHGRAPIGWEAENGPITP
ncbi:radical SAM protein [Streptomyces sp. NPDC007896]|uniref:radical SAM protein n=1 Tax=Streptomyces sp. NPDC007896 TaxID=3364784 RepID=UPI0036EF8189